MKKAWQYSIIFLVLFFLYAPILILAVYSFTDAAMIGAAHHLSVKNYITLVTTEELRHMLVGTFLLAAVVSVCSTLLGTIGAIGGYYGKKRASHVIHFLNHVPVVNADVVTGFSICILIIVLFHINKDTFLPLILGQVVLCTPFVYLSVLPRLKMMDEQIYEAALDLGCNHMQALQKVLLPEIFPGIISGFLTAVTLSLDDYFIACYTKPAAFDTISTYVVNATRGAQTNIKTALWALSTVLFLFVVAFVFLSNIRLPEEETKISRGGMQ